MEDLAVVGHVGVVVVVLAVACEAGVQGREEQGLGLSSEIVATIADLRRGHHGCGSQENGQEQSRDKSLG